MRRWSGGGGGTKKIWAWSCLPFSRFQPALRIGVPQVETAIILLSQCVKESSDWLVSPGKPADWLVCERWVWPYLTYTINI
jgi:hypothetical protein